jgi:two-component system phosphate regulon response regulator OmpR
MTESISRRGLAGPHAAVAGGAQAIPHVLHIDGDGEAALVLATLLTPEARVTHVDTLLAATRAIGGAHYALVVLDPDLPDGDGGILLDTLRAEHPSTPVMLYARRPPRRPFHTRATLLKPQTAARQLWHTLAHLLAAPTAAPLLP